ncbi:hypothetical protein FT643_22165 [Ketobacter sp. MCCC 1A13808]|uniref:hypothetical protein n=1 Tax=Ketobacter sp. MCCC 1A13808 TaxID=2602738 RepID=UPI0012EC7878|nr:hypothetical protein [Ketobacter sp. MCCC 1A13808]MVF14845.1 hypothetical protein [Ketobacter sp. MCCC 1A13808]
MLANAHIQRSHHNRDLMHQRQALRSALKAELCITKETFENRIKQTKDYDNKQHALLQNKVQTSVYDALLSSIGILETEEIKHIVEAYLLVYEIPYRIRLLAGTNAIGGFENEYIRLRPEHIAQVNRIHEALLPKIELAIKSIESNESNA